MIGSALKKFAQNNGLKVAHGVAYGSFRGYAATLSEGNGFKSIVLNTKFSDPLQLQELQQKLNAVDLKKEYRVNQLQFETDGVVIVFLDNPGTMKKLEAFCDWFFPQLDLSTASKADICSECGQQVIGGVWKLVNGVAFYMHSGCAEHLKAELAEEKQTVKPGSYLTGTVGALIGSALGAVVWALVLSGGYLASIVGLLIGFLADKGYDLLKGKQGKGKIAILILAVIFGVVAGTFAADAIALAQMIAGGELPGFTVANIPQMIVLLLQSEPEYASATARNILSGLLFAALGVAALLIRKGKEVSGTSMIDLP